MDGEFSIIGTTDVEYHGDPREVSIDDNEIGYLLNVYNNHFKKQLTREDIMELFRRASAV